MTLGAGCASVARRDKTVRTTDGRILLETSDSLPPLPPLPGEVTGAAAVVNSEPALIVAPPIPLEIAGTGPGAASSAVPPPPPPAANVPDAPALTPAPAPVTIPLTQTPQMIPKGPVGPMLPGGSPFAIAPMAPVECATCGAGPMKGPDAVPSFTCPHGGCGAGGCVPGGKPCYQCQAHTFVGRFFANLYECLCCPDPCYQPRWIPEANAAFFQDYARPRTITRLRWDHVPDLVYPDRSEFFWAQDNGKGRGPKPPPLFPKSGSVHPFHPNVTPIQYKGEKSVLYDQLYMYQEVASARASFFIEYSYRSNDPLLTPHTAGFSDLFLGTKSLLLDCELMQVTFQFKTFLPTGDATKGLGTGHVSLEPSLLMSLRLASQTYFQGQLAEWIPIGGDPGYAGAIIHYHGSLNHRLCELTPDTPLIGTLEANGWTFQDGTYTDPILGTRKASGFSYGSIGPGLRLSVCNKLDVGVGVGFPLSDPHWGNPQVRTEIRFLY